MSDDDISLHTTQVDLGGLMAVLGESLYSTPHVAIRELVQNAHDATTRRRLEAPAGAPEPWILLRGDRAAGTLSIEDPGAGLTRDEIVRYLATIGAGYTRQLRAQTADESLIGMFGLGFLSAYVVADRITVDTTSYREPDRGWRFSSKSGERFSVEPIAAREVGASVVLHLKERFRALSDPAVLGPLVARYACLLPVPVYVGSREVAPVNAEPPPWRVTEPVSRLRADKARRAFAQRFESSYTPLATLDVPRARPGGVVGLLWIQDGGSYASSDNRHVSVFVRGMSVSSDARELLPRWAGFVGGVVESDALSPTASREDLMEDDAYRQAQADVLEALVRGLVSLAVTAPELWRTVLLRHNEALLGACLSEPRLFEALADELTVPTTEGDLTVAAIRARSRGRVHVTLAAHGGYDEVLFRATKVPVAIGTRFAVLPFLRRWGELRHVTVIEVGTESGDRAMFPQVPLDAEAVEWLSARLARAGQKLVPTRFAPEWLPLVVVPDRDAELKARIESDEADRRIGAAVLSLARLHTRRIDDAVRARLYVNLGSPVVTALLEARREPTRAERVERAARMLRVYSSLTVGPNPESAGVEYGAALVELGELVQSELA